MDPRGLDRGDLVTVQPERWNGGSELPERAAAALALVSMATAERWLADHRAVHGTVISMHEASAARRAVFGDVLAPS